MITDGGSTDATPEIISEFVKRGDPILLLREAVALPGRGRNLAAAQAANEWLAFIDAGITPEPNWLESLRQRAQTQIDGEDVDVVYGTYEPVTDSLFKLCAVMAYVAPPYEVEGRLIRPCSVASALMKRSVWRQVGGFPENLRSAEDLLFMRKIEGAGFKIARAPEALVHWQVEGTAWRTFKRFTPSRAICCGRSLWKLSSRPDLKSGTKCCATAISTSAFARGCTTRCQRLSGPTAATPSRGRCCSDCNRSA